MFAIISDMIGPYGPILFVTGVIGFIFLFLNPTVTVHRSLVNGFTASVILFYLYWRLTQTVIPYVVSPVPSTDETAWVTVVFFFEVLTFIEVFLYLLIMSRYNDRHTAVLELTEYPLVDVFIPTYNEPMDVLEKTIIGAMHIDYPNFQVWVLDDGSRAWLKTFCENIGVNYLTRPTGEHAKAGNMNNGLAHAHGDFFAIFDADFVPNRNFIRRTLPYFLQDPTVGIVQTPQNFFNKDPVQSNLNLHTEIPDEQRLFFDEMAPSRDAWGVAFCCGSCSIARRSAIDEAGGIPTDSITEDLLTTLSLLRHGYKTIYHNETLSRGLAAESIEGYFVQRERWCQGGIQTMYLANGPVRASWLSPLQRLLFMPYGWVVQPISRMFILLVPLVYLWYGISPLPFADTSDILFYFAPMLLMLMATNMWLTKKKYLPLLNTAIGIFSSFRLLISAISSIIRPFGRPFAVTPKGSNNNQSGIRIEYVTLFSALVFFLLTLIGMVINTVPELAILDDVEFFPYAVIWGSLNLLYLFITILLCFDYPKPRKEERFQVNGVTALVNHLHQSVVHDISIGGLRMDHIPVQRGDTVELTIQFGPVTVGGITGTVTNSKSFTSIRFDNLSSLAKQRLIGELFTGNYDNTITEYSETGTLFQKLWKRIVQADG